LFPLWPPGELREVGAAALGTGDPRQVAEILAALGTLARHLTPQALARLRATSGSSPLGTG